MMESKEKLILSNKDEEGVAFSLVFWGHELRSVT